MSGQAFDMIVIGAGANGLTAATHAARAGRRVLVLEARDVVGGLAVGPTIAGSPVPGPLHDTSLVSLEVIDSLNLREHGLQLVDAPAVLGLERDGTGILVDADPRRAHDEIARRSPDDAVAYAAYREIVARYGSVLRRVLTAAPPDAQSMSLPSLMTMAGHGLALRRLGRAEMADLLRIIPMCSADWLNEWFDDDLLKATLAGPSIDGTFTGPWSPGNTGCLLRHGALAGQAVEGGPLALISALRGAADSAGVEIHRDAAVSSVLVEDGRVHGVVLADGSSLHARQIIATCDPKQLLTRLVPAASLTRSCIQRIQQYRAVGHCGLLLLALRSPLRYRCRPDAVVPCARTGTTFDAIEKAFDAVKYGRWSDQPILRILQHTSSTGDAAAVASVLVQYVPYHLRNGWNEQRRNELTSVVMGELESYVENLDEACIEHRLLTPLDIEVEFGTTGGHIHHGDHALDQLIVRPTPECAQYTTPIRGLILGGSGVHPGGELTCLPGFLAAQAVA